MREFEFRAWFKNDNHSEMLYEDNRGDVFIWEREGQPITIMQYTEYKDKNGKEIYEYDIVKYKGHNLLVIFFKGHFMLWSKKYKSHEDIWKAIELDEIEIIGNKFQNKEIKY